MKTMTFILVLAIILSACAPAATPTPITPTPTVTPIPPTATPTAPPAPTDTLIPPTFTLVRFTPTPRIWLSKRGYHSAAYDSKADRIIVHGGCIGCTDPDRDPTETWTYDLAGNVWTNTSPTQSPAGGVGTPMAYDTAADRIILAVTWASDPTKAIGTGKGSQTWAYDANTDTWTNLHPQVAPSDLLGPGMVYDSRADRMILFGGLQVPLPAGATSLQEFVFRNETWAYDFKTNTWTNLQPKVSPAGRDFFQMTYDATADRVLVFGGAANTEDSQLWIYDYNANTWTPQAVKGPDSSLHYGDIAYVPTVQRSFLLGGVTSMTDEMPHNNMWTYDFPTQTWEKVQVASDSTPTPRGWHTLTYSPKADRLVLIGSGASPDYFTDEAWIFDPHAKTWTLAKP